MKTEIVPASREMIERFRGQVLLKTIRAVAAVRGEEVLGVAGLYVGSEGAIMFSLLTDELRRDKRGLVKLSRSVADIAKRSNAVYATADPEIEGSEKLLVHMGFQPFNGNDYVWYPHGLAR